MTRRILDEDCGTIEKSRHLVGRAHGRNWVAGGIDEEYRCTSLDCAKSREVLARWWDESIHGKADQTEDPR